MYSLGIDVGGTFTDLVLFNEEKGTIQALKTSSTISNQSEGVLVGIKRLGIDLKQVKRIVHGMTVATNAVIEGKVAKTGLITTKGFRDAIDIAKTNRKVVYDLRYTKPAPLIPRILRREVGERLYADGSVLRKLDVNDVVGQFKQLQEHGIESLAICFLHAYRNPIHEKKARQAIQEIVSDFFVSISSEVVPEYREYERFTTTVLNAQLLPVMDRYLRSLERKLKELDYTEDLFIMHSSGGIMTAEVAREKPIATILSGPVGGIVGASYVAEKTGFKNIITCDMGGTSTDVSLIENLKPKLSTVNEVNGYPVKTPFLDIKTIGAGGGSIAWLDGKNLRVGPLSAGAEPGPACYGKGGMEPSITDANLILGRLNPERALGEEIKLDKLLSLKAMEKIAKEFPDYDEIRIADGILKIVVNNMAMAIHEISVQKGYDPREFLLVAFGGAGPLHAVQIARELGMKKVIIPNIPGNLCALGLLSSDTMLNIVHTYMVETGQVDLDDLERVMEDLAEETYRPFASKGIPREEVLFLRTMDMRYLGQAFEININMPENLSAANLETAFYDAYETLYGQAIRQEKTEIVNLRISAIHKNPKPALSVETASDSAQEGKVEWNSRQVYFAETGWVECQMCRRDQLPFNFEFEGPAIIEEFGSTTVILPGAQVKVDTYGNLLINV